MKSNKPPTSDDIRIIFDKEQVAADVKKEEPPIDLGEVVWKAQWLKDNQEHRKASEDILYLPESRFVVNNGPNNCEDSNAYYTSPSYTDLVNDKAVAVAEEKEGLRSYYLEAATVDYFYLIQVVIASISVAYLAFPESGLIAMISGLSALSIKSWLIRYSTYVDIKQLEDPNG